MNIVNKHDYLTPKQIADELQLNVLTIYEYIKSKKLPALIFGRYYRIRKEDFDAFLSARRTV